MNSSDNPTFVGDTDMGGTAIITPTNSVNKLRPEWATPDFVQIGMEDGSRRNAVSVRNAYKEYGPNVILNNFNMTVKEGTM